MQHAFPLSKINCLFADDEEEIRRQQSLDRLSEGKIHWEKFLEQEDFRACSRLASSQNGRSLLHLAVLDARLDVMAALSQDPSLKTRQDTFGLSPIDVAQLLDRKDCLQLLQPLADLSPQPTLPPLKDFTYLSRPLFENKETFENVLNLVGRAKKEDKIPAEKIWMGVYFDKELRKGIHPLVSVRLVDAEVGFGVFAEKKIPACTFVGEYTGVVQERLPKELKEKCYCLRYPMWEGKRNFAVDGENRGNFTRFINHSLKPNLCLQSIYWRGIPRMIFVALKEIREGGQLTFDYGPLFWKESPQSPKLFDDH